MGRGFGVRGCKSPGLRFPGGGRSAVACLASVVLSSACGKASPPSEIWRPDPPPREFRTGDTVPGFVSQAPSGGRAEVRAASSHAEGLWTVLLERELATRDPANDVDLSDLLEGAVASFSVAVLNDAPGPNALNMAAQDTRPFTLGVAGTGADVEVFPLSAPPRVPEDFPGGPLVTTPIPPTPAVTLRAAHDGSRLFLLAEWPDPSPSDERSRWSFSREGWSRRGGDDLLLLLWDLGSPNPDGASCALLCHAEDALQARMRTLAGRVDAWIWSASRTGPAGFADDRSLGPVSPEAEGVSAFADDPGRPCFLENRKADAFEPAYVASRDPGAIARALFRGPAGTGIALPASAEASPRSGEKAPAWVLRPAQGSSADVTARSQFAEGSWTVLLSRPLATGDAEGDLDFSGFPGGRLAYFTVAVRDDGDGPSADADADPRPFTLGPPDSGADLEAPRATPAGAGDFRGRALVTAPPGNSPALTLRAAYDTSNLYLLATWKDAGASAGRTPGRWVARKGAWEREPGGEDTFLIAWSQTATGCATRCHTGEAGGPRFRSTDEPLDAWAWRAGRTDPLGLAEDLRLLPGEPAALPDAGTAPYLANEAPGGAGPAFVPREEDPRPVQFLLDLAKGVEPSVPSGFVPDEERVGGPTFVRDVAPALRGCVCHRSGNTSGGLRLDTYATVMLGGSHRGTNPEVVPGKPLESLLYQKVSMTQPPVGQRMPLGGPYLSLAEIERIRAWIEAGAVEK